MVAASVATLLTPALVPSAAFADITSTDLSNGACSGTNGNLGGTSTTGCTGTAAQDKLNSLIKTIVNLFSVIVGVISVIMIIVGGLKYITSGGEASNISGAKNTIIYAIVGLVIVALAQFIVHFVLSKATTA